MNKTELKKILKPLIKECIKECIFEEGVLSGLITEVVQGLNQSNKLVENLDASNIPKKEMEEKYELEKQKRIKKLNERHNGLFEGTREIIPESSGHGPLTNVAPDDAGVNIDGIMNIANGRWKNLI